MSEEYRVYNTFEEAAANCKENEGIIDMDSVAGNHYVVMTKDDIRVFHADAPDEDIYYPHNQITAQQAWDFVDKYFSAESYFQSDSLQEEWQEIMSADNRLEAVRNLMQKHT